MATVTLKDIIGYVSLTKMVKLNVPDLPRRLPPSFYAGTPEKVEADGFRFTQFRHARTTASTANYYSPSKPVSHQPIGSRDVKLFHSIENFIFEAWMLEALRDFENYDLQERGKQYVTLQVAEFRRRFKHLRDILALLILTKGIVYRNSNGELLPSSAGADPNQTADFGINNTTNRGTIAAVTGTLGAWNSSTTNIVLQLETMRVKAQQAHGYIPTIILYGKNIPSYITANDYIQPYLARNLERRNDWLKEGHITPSYDLFGFEWYPVYDAGFQNSAGTYGLPIGDDDIIMFPQGDESWWGWAEGSYTVPTNLNVTSGMDATDFLAGTAKIYGPFGYCKVMDDPVRMIGISGDTCTPFVKIPDAVWQLTAV